MLEPEEDNIVTRPKSTSIIDLRNDAELRARHIEINQKKELIQAQVAKQAAQRSADKAMRKKRETMMINAADITKNRTPLEAKIAEIDYRLNGSRARVNSGEFIPPRWVPDEEVVECILCRVEFDWVCRKHHCRYTNTSCFITYTIVYKLTPLKTLYSFICFIDIVVVLYVEIAPYIGPCFHRSLVKTIHNGYVYPATKRWRHYNPHLHLLLPIINESIVLIPRNVFEDILICHLV